MEDKNLQPLEPDMLYRHGQPEATEPEAPVPEAVLCNSVPAPEDVPAPIAEEEVPFDAVPVTAEESAPIAEDLSVAIEEAEESPICEEPIIADEVSAVEEVCIPDEIAVPVEISAGEEVCIPEEIAVPAEVSAADEMTIREKTAISEEAHIPEEAFMSEGMDMPLDAAIAVEEAAQGEVWPEQELEVPPMPIFPEEAPVFPDVTAPFEPQQAYAGDEPPAAFFPQEGTAFAEESGASLEDTIPPVLPEPEPYQPICDDNTLAWLTGEEAVPQESPYETMVPEVAGQFPAPIFPEPTEPEYSDMFIDSDGEEEPPPVKKKKNNPPVKKGRPKRKKGYGFLGIPHMLATLVWLAIIVAIGSALGKLMWVGAADVLAFGRESNMVTVTIVDSDTIDTIAAKLQEAGLVKYPELFKLYAKITGDDEEITTGTFELNTILDYHALTNALSPSSSNRTVVKVTIPEGYSCRQVFNLLANSNVCSVESLEEYAANGELNDYWFLEGIERGDRYCLEGFLFPDTYEFYVNSTPSEVLNKMLSGFNTRFSEELRGQIDTLNTYIAGLMRANGKSEEQIAAAMFSVHDVLIVASMVEKETAGSAESATIASVIYNRLYNWGDTPPYLNIDASIYYALDGNIDPNTGNTMVLTSEDMKVDSPFNTYLYPGLTPTPITNPGLASIQAALNPESTGYYYYVLNPETNVHQFSKTLEEHEKWVEQFYPKSEG